LSGAARDLTGELLARLRAERPRVHCITNAAAVAYTANVLLAAGCIPSMTVNPPEVPGFIHGASALLVNLGTLDPLRAEAIDVAIRIARTDGKPWALDPVFVERSPTRLGLARDLARRHPAVIRANRAELAALSGSDGGDAAARLLARESGAVVVRTGEVDFATDGTREVEVAGGHPLMALVTASGCAGTALMAGFLAVETDRFLAAAACLAFVKAAAERAGATARGPGSFVPAYLDALYALDPQDFGDRIASP
jgi:hydroxyethylthiazole kinase